MKPKRIFQVYRDETGSAIDITSLTSKAKELVYPNGKWRFRVLAPRAPVAHRIVGGSGEAFDSKSNALRAARREVSLYPPGVAVVEVG